LRKSFRKRCRKTQVLTCSGVCIGSSLSLLIKAITAKVNTTALSEIVIEVKLIPIGESPRNKPASPSKPKLNATDNTNSSTKSSLFLFINKILTKQYPGKNATKTKPKT